MNCLRRGASGFELKLFALLMMTLDHIHYFIPDMPLWLTLAGRLAAPIFLFLCVEGFGYTRSRPKYLLRMYTFAVGMRFVSLALCLLLPRQDGVTIMNDIFATMFVVCWCVAAIDLIRSGEVKKCWFGALMLAAMLAATAAVIAVFSMVQRVPLTVLRLVHALLPTLFSCEGGILWVLLGILFYYARGSRRITVAVYLGFIALHLLLVPLDVELLLEIGCTAAAIVPICLYNGKPGKHRCKWLFYTYYPAHVYLLYLISWFMVR